MKKYDVVGIGNAVVDIISPCDDRFLEKMGIEKGIMQLIEKDRSEFLYNSMGARTNAAGGSVANTVAGISSCLLYTSPSPRDLYQSRMPSSA